MAIKLTNWWSGLTRWSTAGICLAGIAAGALPAGAAEPAAATVASQPASRAEYSAARDEVLRSEPWRELISRFDSWLSTQTLYDADQVREIRARLEAGILRMSVAQMQQFQDALADKLEVLEGPQTTAAEAYLDRLMVLASPEYTRLVRSRLPDVLTTPAPQIERKLSALVAQRQSTANVQKAFNRSRQERFDMQRRAAEELAAERANAPAVVYVKVWPAPVRTKDDFYMTGGNFNTGYDGSAGLTWSLDPPRF